MWTPTGNILRTTALLLALGLMLSLVSTGPGTGVQAAETILPSSNILCVCDADKSGSIDRSEAVDGVTSYLVQIEKPGLGRPLTRTEAVTLVTNYLLSLHFECPTEVDPIASWPFEENPAATTTVDISGNGHTGQVTDAVSLPGAKGRAFEFNGSTSVVSVPDGPGLDGMDAMTVQAWVYPKSYPQTSYPHEAGIVSKWGPGGVGDDSWFLTLNGDQHEGKVYFAVGGTNGADNSSIRSTSTVPLNQWSRVTGVFERNKRVSLYINGTLVGSTTAYDLPVHDTSQQLTIGRAHGDGSGPRWFDGCIDEVKVWDVAQVPDAVTPPTTGCQVSDIETFSLGGHPNDITFDGHNVWVTNAPAGKVSKLDLNGNVLLSTSVGQTPMGIDSDGEFVWVSDVNDTKLRKLNPNTGAVVCEVTIASSLNGVLFDGRDIWVANPANNAINKVSTSCQMLGQFSVAGNPDNLGFDGQNVWASGWTSNKVTKIDGFDGSNKGEFDVASKTNETVFDGRHVWVAKDPSATLTKLLASDGQNIGDFAIGSRSYGAASDSVFVFAANYDTGTVSKLSVRDGSLQDTYSVGSMPAAVAIDGRNVWVANGGDGTVSKIKDAADGFDVEDQLGPPKPNISYEQWTRKADMPTMRVRLGATVDRAGQVFVIGGHSSSADLATVEVFDPVGDAWATGTSTPQARSGIGAATGGYGKVFSIGGSFNNGGGSTGLVEAYDQDAGVWSVASSLDHNRYAIRVVTASNGRIYAIGGVTGSNQQGVVFNEEYNPATDTWTTRAPMPTLRWGVGLAATPDGLIYAIGGNRDGCPCQLAAAEVYDVFTDTWTALPPMPSPRGNVRVEVGTNGLIYAMGGQASTGPELPTVEVFDPANSTWSQGVDMPVGRGAGEAVVGFDGRIYVFGGSSDFGSQLESVYEFGPIPTARVVFYSSEHGNTDIFSMNLDGSNRRRLTDSTTCDVQPRLSPDGTMIAYNRACSGQPNEIVVMDPAGNELASWQTTTGDRAQDPAWSPDGRRLAYRCGGTQVCLRDWQGSAPSELLFDAASSGKDAISRFEWSPDGRYLLLSWAASGGRWGIGRIDVPARTAQEFIPHGNPGMVFDARYSPDGMSVVFSRESGGLSTGDVRLADSEGQNEQALVTGIAGAHATDWNENGRIYFYSSNSPDTGDEVYSILSDGAGLRRLTDNAFADQYPDAWVPDVLPIAFQSRWDGNDEIYLMAPDGSHKTRITQNTDDDREPAWSPDGSQIAFQSIRDGNWEIYVMNRDGSGPTNLTNHTGKDERPSWSPDGSQIVFFSNRDGNEEIYKMDADGGNQTNISNNSAHDEGPDWSPDGAKIAFRSERDGDHEIFTMSPSGDPSSVVQLTHNGVQDGPPTWSPDGRMISFDSPSNGNYDVYVMDASGGNLTRLTAETGQDVAPDWSADGSKIIYSSQRQGNWDVFSMNSDGTAKTRLTQDVDFDLYPHWRPVKQPDLTEPKQRIIIQSDRSGDEEVYEIDLQGNVLRRLTDSPGADGSPMYSPDGSRIAFYSDRNGPDREIFVMNRDLSGLRQLTFNDVDDVSPTWCGNDRIAYMFDYNQIHIMNADGSDTRLLISGQAPSCASDGAALLVNQSGNIVTVDPATGVATTLGSGGAAVWSPGGKQIAYDDGKNLFVMDLATKAVTQITNDPATDANPQWSPGPAILFTSHRPGNSDIYMINSDGSGLRNVTVNPARDGQASWWIPPVETKGGFTAAINYPAGSNPFDVRVGDVDGDGDPDVLTGNMDSKDISILFNNGRGVLGAANAYDAGGHVTGISTPNDLDADGDLDVVAALAPPNEMAVVFNDGSGQFAVTSKNSYGPAAKSIAEGDFDRDGDMDVAVPLEPNGFSVFLNDGDGTFTSNGHMSASSGLPYQLAVGDLDGDRDLDIVGAINLSNKIEVFLNDGSGAFSSTSTHPTQTWPRGIVLIDIDLDGDLDVAAANQTSHSVSIFLNNGHGNLGDATHYPTGADPRDLAAGDFDRDGFPDLATANYGGNNVSVLLNR
ncbi:MAG: FG-GAP-like repeat-containing protein, partial [SAR202 cluster bacterium]|nr:FG-GAP-like repeat-containing protein [SAR202 cluster bacterium]